MCSLCDSFSRLRLPRTFSEAGKDSGKALAVPLGEELDASIDPRASAECERGALDDDGESKVRTWMLERGRLLTLWRCWVS